MVNILLVCTAGMSTSFLVEKMKKAATDQGIEANIEAIPDSQAKEHVDNTDVVLLGPQVKFLLNNMKKLFPDTPVDVINMRDYGTMNGEKVLASAMELSEGKA